MSFIGHDVQLLEQSHHRVVVGVTPSIPVVCLFSGLASLISALAATKPVQARRLGDMIVPLAAILFFGSFAFFGAIGSTFTADRNTRQLTVTRELLWWQRNTVFDGHSIDCIFVRETPKGSALRLGMKSGKVRRLTLWHDFRVFPLQQAAIALNVALT